jgi:DNA replication protein DnaC
MDDKLKSKLKYLGLKYLDESWKDICECAHKTKSSYHKFLSDIIEKEYLLKKDRARLARLKAAKLPEIFLMENYPFSKQPKLKKKLVMESYDSLSYMEQCQSICFIGRTGVGKTGLAISLLVNAIDNGFCGRYITFSELMEMLLQSGADFSSKNMISKFAKVDCLFIDDLGVGTISDKLLAQAGLFFSLMDKRHNKTCTIISTQLGFDDWGTYFNDSHLTAALIDRLTVNCIVFDMQKCKSLRPKNVTFGTVK